MEVLIFQSMREFLKRFPAEEAIMPVAIHSPDGRVFNRSEDAANAYNLSASTIRSWSRRNINGWKKLERVK